MMTRNHPPATLIEGEDYYPEGEHLVFTETYHLKRGYCCQSGCRHCPYKNDAMHYSTKHDTDD